MKTRHRGNTVTPQREETDAPAQSLTVTETLICSRFCFTELVPGQERAGLRSPQNHTCCRDRAGRMRRRTFSNVQVEEVAVEDGLDDTGHHGDEVEEALEVEAPDPVDEIERAVEAQEEQVVSGDGLRLPGLADHEELREDGHRLKVDGEGPQNLEEKHTLCQNPVPTTGPPETRLSSVGQRRERESGHQSLGQ